MITPRRTRLIRVPDLQGFRRAIGECLGSGTLVVVPTRSAARQLAHTLAAVGGTFDPSQARALTRDQLYDDLHARLPDPPRRLNAFDRDAVAQAASVRAAAALGRPFRLRPGLIAETLRFYDQLRRQGQQTARFEELIAQALGGEAALDPADRGAVRMLQQTRFLAATFREYERMLAEAHAVDEHALRDQLLATAGQPAAERIIVTVADWIADPDGLFAADFDLAARLPNLAALDIVCTERVLASGFHERLHNWLPEIEEVRPAGPAGKRPRLLAPSDQFWFTVRDREEELATVCRRLRPGSRTAVVFKHPLPYLYAAPETFGAAAVPYETTDALPLAAEPFAAAVDLVLDLAESAFSREAIVAVLRSPHFEFLPTEAGIGFEQVAALNQTLSAKRYLGELDRLEALAGTMRDPGASRALDLALTLCRELSPLLAPAPASIQLDVLHRFLQAHARPLGFDDRFAFRERRVRKAIVSILTSLQSAQSAHHDPLWTIDELGPAVRRWIEEETFVPDSNAADVQLLDDQAARYGEFNDLALVGLVEREWPEAPRRNIFYPPSLLKALGWPSEKDRRGAADALFLDLLCAPSDRVWLSTVTLDDEALVSRSLQLDEVANAGLDLIADEAPDGVAFFADDSLVDDTIDASRLVEPRLGWAEFRAGRPDGSAPDFHGSIGPRPAREWSVSALETYLSCPFKFFAQHVLTLEEEPDDEEVMDPRRQGQFVHAVFEAFFAAWQRAGHGAITPANLPDARAMFAVVVDEQLQLQNIPVSEAGIERTRLLGSPAAAGLGDAVLRMEAERPIPLVERLLEHRLSGPVTIATSAGPRVVALRGKADRLDLLADGTFRLIDYKLGWPPQRARSLQLPIYSLSAEQRLDGHRGRHWTLGEAAYLAFKGPRRVVPLFANDSERVKVLADAQQRLSDTLDAIDRGEFPPTPDDVYRCETCSFAAVCRKDYVGDV